METREIAVLGLGIIFFISYAGLRSLKFGSTGETLYELERRAATNNEPAIKALEQERLLPDILTFRHILEALLVVFMVSCLVFSLGWLLGIIVSVIALLGTGMLARFGPVALRSYQLYRRHEDAVLAFISRLKPGLRFVRDASDKSRADFSLHSKEELLHLVSDAKTVLTESEHYLLEHALKFESRYVSEIMTPRSMVETVEAKEVMGPIVLDRLHKSGHSRFPVIEKDLDHVIGLLYVHDLFSIAKSTKTSTANKLMEQKVFYINENQPLPSALAGFLRVKHHLFIVVNEFEETTGVITLEDVVEALIGRKIIDEFDQYDDLRAVAKRAATLRHKSETSTHIK